MYLLISDKFSFKAWDVYRFDTCLEAFEAYFRVRMFFWDLVFSPVCLKFSPNCLYVGDLIAQISAIAIVKEVPTCVTATNCAEWQNGVVAITGHDNGKVCLWGLQNLSADGPSKSIDFSDEGSQQSNFSTQGAVRQLRVMQVLEGVHSEAITAIRVHKDQREIVVGDGSGKLSRWASVRVDELKDKELQDLFLVLGDAAVVVKKGRRRSHLPQDRD